MALRARRDAAEVRLCPDCGTWTPLQVCGDDHTPTIGVGHPTLKPEDLRTGDLIDGRYRIDAEIGRGAFCVVFSATRLATRQRVALKVTSVQPDAGGVRHARRLWREARVMATLDHANVVRVCDLGQDPRGPIYLALELVEGETLEAMLARRFASGATLSEAEAIDLAVQLLDALSAAHDAGVCHRDIKPSNVMLSCDAQRRTGLKVLDFGVAWTPESSVTARGAVVGTPAFMSPEQAGGGQVSAQSDLYSVGVLLYLCLTGVQPFRGRSAVLVLQAHVKAPVPDPRRRVPQLSDEIAELVMRAMAKDPAKRHAGARAMRRALLDLPAANLRVDRDRRPPSQGTRLSPPDRSWIAERTTVDEPPLEAELPSDPTAEIPGRKRRSTRRMGTAMPRDLWLKEAATRG